MQDPGKTPPAHAAPIAALVFVVHLANAFLAAWIGYLTPDSWSYLGLARSLYVNGYPNLGETYYAIFPFGYPLLLALVSPGLDLAQTAVASKLANAGLWISIYFLLRHVRISPILAAALVMTPFSLWIAARTWSENLMLLALILTLAGIERLQEGTSRRSATSILLLLAALLLGIASRYVFGFVIVGFAAAYLISFRRALRPSVFLAFALAEAFFAFYLLVNLRLTGYSTGMERIAAPESASELVFAFAHANHLLLLSMVLPFAAIALLTVRHWRLNPIATMTALAGIAYLVIIAYLRWRSYFDPFDQRLLGPGWFLLGVALALAAPTHEPAPSRRLGAIGLVGFSLGAGYWVHADAARALIKSGEALTSPTQAIRDYERAFHRDRDITSVISLQVPFPRISMDGNAELYYGNLPLFIPRSAPFTPSRETLDAFRKRVLAAGIDLDHCAIDFSHLAAAEQLSKIIDARYSVGSTKLDRRFDPALVDRVHEIFRASSFVPCSEFLKDTLSSRPRSQP